ncbi:MAG: ribbon-helix-helix domain-containing protein [Syntrophaceae bacterium]|nr:ribbon-helix-helix domain-containing protein [Syntrophaceae bacterium]
MEEKKMFATRINKDLLKKLKILSVHQEKPINSLLEEAIQELLRKYQKTSKESP